MGDKNQNFKHQKQGFTLIELLVVVAIISLLSSVALIAFMSARQKSRDVKRLSDMTQMSTAMGLFFSTNSGYPSSTNGVPNGIVPTFASSLPGAPMPEDGVCQGQVHSSDTCTGEDNNCANVPLNTYYYVASGTPLGNGAYPSFSYYFCLGNQTGNFPAGLKRLTPTGVR